MTPLDTDALLALLPTFEAATRRRAVESVATRLAEGRSLEDVVGDTLGERDQLEAAVAEAVAACRQAPPGDRAPVTAFYRLVMGAPDRRANRAIASGRISVEALEERASRDLNRLETETLVAFLAVDAIDRQTGRPAAFSPLAERLAGQSSWLLARAGLQALAVRAQAGRPPSRQALAAAHALVAGGDAPVWTQVAAIDLLAAAAGPACAPVLAARLRPRPDPDDVFVRAAAVRALARVHPDAARAAFGAQLAGETSEHVRMEVASQLGALNDVQRLGTMFDPAREPSPRVRAAAAIALGGLAPDALVTVLENDPDEIPRRIALEEAERLAPRHPPLLAAIERLAAGRTPVPPALARLAAEAAERLHHQLDAGARAALEAARLATQMPEGRDGTIPTSSDEAAFGRALALLATDDFGFEARRVRRGFRVARGDRFGRRLWRVLHEARHPAPGKRQSHPHSVGRVHAGPLRAPPGKLAEVTVSRVPGERVLAPDLGDWGRHLPAVDDLLDRPSGGEAYIFSAFGVTRLRFPDGWSRRAGARAALTVGYARYAELRRQSLATDDPAGRGGFAGAIAKLGYGLEFYPYRGGAPAEVLEVLRGSGGGAGASVALGLSLPPLAELSRGLLDPSASSASHLAALTLAAVGLFVVRQNEARRRIERARASIPLSLGGWGTRGKSGTERLKAALFQGLGCEVLAKTTGCEAMLIHALPGRRAHEIFIYRPYDKATIWEQQHVLEIAARLDVDVFLWECMALRPGYVEILEQHWMRDSICTLTNAYPDHEDIQGPAGIDIPRCMVPFIPTGRHLLTAEDSMLPIFRQAAAERSTTLSAVSYRDHALLPADLLARFPYQEHPHNIALVVNLARLLGVPREVALQAMSDWVVPDLGVLKTYPEARWRGRRLQFSNGMSANERTGFLNNWQRLGFDRPAPPGQWVVTVVNNRDDRVSRSQVFAEVVVNDAAAHAHVLIGTNLTGLRGYIEDALLAATRRITLLFSEEHALPPRQQAGRAFDRAGRQLAQVRLPEVGPARLAREAEAMARGLGLQLDLPQDLFAQVLDATLSGGASRLADLEQAAAGIVPRALGRFLSALGPHGQPAARYFVRETARHAAALRWQQSFDPSTPGGRALGTASFLELYADLFRASLIVLPDPLVSGDQIVDALAAASPPGFGVRIMGLQNIKGTGLDFAYRWIAYDRTVELATRLSRLRGPAALAVASELAGAEDAGMLDGPVAEEAVRAAASRESGDGRATLLAMAAQISARQAEREQALGQVQRGRAGPFTRAVERVLDIYDGMHRRRRADQIVDELVRGHLSHERAARDLRDLVKRGKGGWLGSG